MSETPTPNANGNYKRITRRKGACGNCRARKVRCDGASTCGQCVKSHLHCTYTSTSSSHQNHRPRTSSSVSRNSGATPSTTQLGPLSGTSTPGLTYAGSCFDSPGLSALGGSRGNTLSTTQSPQQWLKGKEDYFGTDWIDPEILDIAVGSLGSVGQQSVDFNFNNPDLPLPVDEPFQDEEGINAEFDIGLKTPVSLKAVEFGVDLDWTRTWTEDMCKWHSQALELSKRLWMKARTMPKDSHDLDGDECLPPYAHQDTTQFIDGSFPPCLSSHLTGRAYQIYCSYPNFVTRSYIDSLLVDMVISPNTVDRAACALFNAVLAIGCRVLAQKDCPYDSGIQTNPLPQSSRYFARALRCRDALMNGQATMVKLQALVTMTLYMRHSRNISLTRFLLSQAIHMVQEVTLSAPTTPLVPSGHNHQTEIEGIFWLLYSIEKPFTLRTGGHTMIDDNMIAYTAPTKRRASISSTLSDYTGWDLLHYRYARLCSVIIKTLYTQSSKELTACSLIDIIARLNTMLESWRMSIPPGYRPEIRIQSSTNSTNNSELGKQQIKTPRAWDSCIQNDIFLKYAEAAFAIHRWGVVIEESRLGSDLSLKEKYEESGRMCVEVAKGVLRMVGRLRVANDAGDVGWHHIALPALSTTVLSMTVSKPHSNSTFPSSFSSPSATSYLPYLGMACGYFGRLSTTTSSPYSPSPIPDLFPEVAEILSMARGALIFTPTEEKQNSTGSQARRMAESGSCADLPGPKTSDFSGFEFSKNQSTRDNIEVSDDTPRACEEGIQRAGVAKGDLGTAFDTLDWVFPTPDLHEGVFDLEGSDIDIDMGWFHN
ncbi:hypothetical protein GQ43DRAFT_435816 [Delitschia confertaspora ATCC 74209]|uniref:Zn(2)-C6 fungal-type domain-containing protein n=1 Tax=Delitschia confertaspora ATCC 74209 TaxID=1513339 RepID=A0A9P4JHL6_9PLEO|nr:hypothetical protein GQ43DRAFT_435816 [Delitschia confertaspora ATCC 74209]